MTLGARTTTVSRKSLTTDRLMRFPGASEDENDSPTEGEKHTMLTLPRTKVQFLSNRTHYHFVTYNNRLSLLGK